MILQMPWGGERVNTIRNKRPERPQHILNYSRIDGHASWALLPKNKPNLGEVTIFFLGSDHPPYVRHLRLATPLSSTHFFESWSVHKVEPKSSKNRTRICRMQQSRNAVKSSLVQWLAGVGHRDAWQVRVPFLFSFFVHRTWKAHVQVELTIELVHNHCSHRQIRSELLVE